MIDLNIPKEELITLTNFLPIDAKKAQRKWHIINQIHTIQMCLICNSNPVNWDNSLGKYRTYCSAKCRNQDPTWKDKYKKACIEKYGVDNSRKSVNVQQKIQKTKVLKYGSKNNITKIQKTCMELYGVDNVRKTEKVKEQIRHTNIERYGDVTWLRANPEKIKNILIARYGQDNYFKTDVFKHNNKQFWNELYQVDSQTQKHYGSDVLDLLKDYNYLYQAHILDQQPASKIALTLEVDQNTVLRWLKFHNIQPKRFSVSVGERELFEYVYNICPDAQSNVRSVIYPYELDVYIPSKKVAFEYCGLYWHSNSVERITPNYHLNKLDMCNKLGIRLITIFEDEWIFRKDIIFNTISYVLNNISGNKVYAKACNIRQVTTDKKPFFEKYHLMGDGKSSLNIGLFADGVMVACAGFKQLGNRRLELNRYATSTLVVGGLGKILKYIKKQELYTQIVTFADRRWSNGTLYEKTGFVCDKTIKPDYRYVVGNRRIHKFNFRHKHLPSILGTKYNPTLSESENCKNIPRIWDCGLKRFVLTL